MTTTKTDRIKRTVCPGSHKLGHHTKQCSVCRRRFSKLVFRQVIPLHYAEVGSK